MRGLIILDTKYRRRMTPDFEKGQRERLGLESVEFEAFEYERDGMTRYLYAHKDIRPVQLQSILEVLDNLYGRTRQEFLGDALSTQSSTVFTLFEPEGVWALEYHDEDLLSIQIKQEDLSRFLNKVDSRFKEELYKTVDIDPEDITDEAPL